MYSNTPNLIQPAACDPDRLAFRRSSWVTVVLCICLTLTSGCITFQFETEVDQTNNIEIKFETPIASKEVMETTIAPTIPVTPSATPQAELLPAIPTSRFLATIVVPSNTNAGIPFTAPFSSTYIFQYNGATSLVRNGDGVHWVTEVFAFQGPEPQWADDSLNYDAALFKLGWSGYQSQEAALDSTKRGRSIVHLSSGEVITLVVGDGKPWYDDNKGEIILDVFVLPLLFAATNPALATPVIQDSIVTFAEEFNGVSYGWNTLGQVSVKEDHVEIIGTSVPGNSEIVSQKSIAVGTGAVFLLTFTDDAQFSVNVADKSVNWNSWIGMDIRPDAQPKTTVAVNNQGFIDGQFMGGKRLEGNLTVSPDRWYFVLIRILKGGAFYIRIWDQDAPQNYREAGIRLGDEWENHGWFPNIIVATGQVNVDSYQELQFYESVASTPRP